MSGRGQDYVRLKERSLEVTPSWAVAVVVFVILVISIALEYAFHFIGHWLHKKHKRSLHEALEKIKAELMLLGFISLLLTVGQDPISDICIPSRIARTWHPCNKEKEDDEFYDPCLKKGKVQMVSNYGIHQLHIFIFVLAVVHVVYCILTMVLGRLKMRKWRVWEDETKTVEYQYHNDPERFRFARETTFGRRHLRFWSNSTVLLWIGCFFRQFFTSVAKVDYLTLRHGFINTHLTPESQLQFDFHKYISRSLEEDFKVVVGISPVVWFFAVLLLLTNTHDWYAYLWLPFIPLIIILIVGAKLQVIITKMGRRTHEMADVIKGTPTVKPGDDLFWFGRPKLVLLLINFVLFQNAFQLAFLLWSWYTFGFKSCFHHRNEDIIIRITMGVVIQFLCSYVTLPLYALVTQMGSRMKPSIFSDNVAKALKTWHHTAKKNVKHGTLSAPGSPFSSRPGTPLHGSTSPMHLLHRYQNDSLDSLSNSPRHSGLEHEGWANESPSTHHHLRYQERENFRRDDDIQDEIRDEVPDFEEIKIQEPNSSSTQLPSGPRPVRTQHEVDISDFSFGQSK
uniref:MLO-like protein n=1 Tax=Tanacetum cinerariifolium TaxID=118510 RepID=A0A6L2M054_TANCI|nr:MLO-like protein 12 [Tanacetum cinerariifolium]